MLLQKLSETVNINGIKRNMILTEILINCSFGRVYAK